MDRGIIIETMVENQTRSAVFSNNKKYSKYAVYSDRKHHKISNSKVSGSLNREVLMLFTTKLHENKLMPNRAVPRSVDQPVRITPMSSGNVAQRRSSCACGGICPQCQAEQAVQPKLRIGAPNDKYEQEADRVADHVMSKSAPRVQRQSLATGHDTIQTKIDPGQASGVTPHTSSRIHSLQGGGQPLSASTRRFFESRMGQDLSQVRVHTNDRAADTADAIHARAYTLGKDIVFSRGQYAPDSQEGKRLLAHELVHIGQQHASHLIRRQAAPGQQRTPAQCNTALNNVTYVLNASIGIGMGDTWLQPGSTISFINTDSKPHNIEITPYLVSSANFTVPPGGRVTVFASRVTSVQGGSIVDTTVESVHDLVICP
jgi:plastocyanin